MTVSILFKNKKGTHLFLRCRLRYRDEVRFVTFQSYFTNAIVSVEEDTYAAVYATTTPKGQKKQCFYSRNRL
jgi:hypothetical protein